jgi:hypothetical protein
MVSPKVCRHEVLASNGVAQVQRCLDCDCVSIHVGPLTFRLDPTSLEGLWAVLGDAAMALHARRARLPSSARGVA